MPKYDLTTAPDAELFGLLADPSFTNRMLAGNQLLRRAREGKKPHPNDDFLRRMTDKDVSSGLAGWVMFVEQAGGTTTGPQQYREVFREGEKLGLAPDQHSTLVLRSLTARPKWEADERGLLLDALKTFNVPHIRRAAAEAMTAHPHADFVAPLVGMLKSLAPGDDHTRYSVRVALRNCLRDADGWKAVAADDVPWVLDVALGVPDATSARFLAGLIGGGNANDGQRLAMAFHIGRFGDRAERDAVLRYTFRELPGVPRVDAAGWAIQRELLKGMAAGGKTLSAPESQLFHQEAVGLIGTTPRENPAVVRGQIEFFSLLPAVTSTEARPDATDNAQALFARLAGFGVVSAENRTLAVEALGRINTAASVKTLSDLLADAKTPTPLKEKAVVALSNVNHPDARAGLKEALKGQPYRVAVAVAQNMAGSKGGAAGLFAEVKGGTIPARVLQEKVVLERLRAAKVDRLDPQLAELTKGLPPADERLAQLIRERAARFAAAPADAAEGAKVFVKHCAACHQIGTVGNRVGPQLDGIGVRGLERLLEDVLDPNRNIDAAFRARVLTLADGTTKTGLQLRTEGQVLVFADNEGKEFRLASKEIETNRETNLSPMPANVGDIVPEAEFRHLMAYLLSQRAAEVPKK